MSKNDDDDLSGRRGDCSQRRPQSNPNHYRHAADCGAGK
jgi:hypothetical protein